MDEEKNTQINSNDNLLHSHDGDLDYNDDGIDDVKEAPKQVGVVEIPDNQDKRKPKWKWSNTGNVLLAVVWNQALKQLNPMEQSFAINTRYTGYGIIITIVVFILKEVLGWIL